MSSHVMHLFPVLDPIEQEDVCEAGWFALAKAYPLSRDQEKDVNDDA